MILSFRVLLCVPRVFFLRGQYQSIACPYHKETEFLALNKVDAVTVSEVLSDLAALASKEK